MLWRRDALQTGLIVCSFILMQLENLQDLSNWCDNFQFNVIRCGLYVATLNFSRRLAESYVTVMQSVICKDRLHWWYNHVAHLVASSTALASLINMRKKCKSTSLSAIQVENRQKTIGTEEKLDIISGFKKRWMNCCHTLYMLD